jgi:glycosyltransferase involved in cell wall biosynthesis
MIYSRELLATGIQEVTGEISPSIRLSASQNMKDVCETEFTIEYTLDKHIALSMKIQKCPHARRQKVRTVLFVMPDAFHLGWMGATCRLFHFAEAFRKIGFDVVLLAGKRTNRKVQASIDQQFPGLVLRTLHTGAYPRIVDVGRVPRRAWRALWKMHGAEYYAARLSFGWSDFLDISKVIRELEHYKVVPDLIFGISGGYLEGGAAADRLARVFNVPWILELRDPPRWCGLGPERATVREKFLLLLKGSARQIVTSDSYRRYLIESFDLRPESVWTIYRCVDDKIQINCREGGTWRILYAGSLDGGRSLAPLIYGYRRALEQESDLKTSSCIEVAGTGPGIREAKELSKRLGIELHVYGNVPKEHADELAGLASLLVLVQSEEACRFQIPGKLFDYMAYGKPILAIMPECEAADIARRSGLGFIHPSEDIDGIADTLIKLWSDWRAGVPSVQMNCEYISQFSVKLLPERLRQVLEGLL